MRNLSPEIQDRLTAIFGTRATFDPFQCRFYRSDVGALPSLVAPMIGNTMPAGVVQLRDEGQLIELVKLARQYRVPLVPRGKASSGYGGVIPVDGGVVVDFTWMGRILDLDAAAGTVTVEPGIVWENLDRQLRAQGLALRTYPSSAPSSTVGGWLAQGGMGYGAFQYGFFRDNVVSARVVLPTGEVREFSGEDLDLIGDAEGTTGFISAVTMRVRRDEPHVVWGARFATADGLTRALRAVKAARLPFWSISFINPTMADLKNQLPPRMEHGHIASDQPPELPVGYLAIFVGPERGREAIDATLREIVAEGAGQLLNDHVAAHEWEERFSIMHVKRLGPSVAPAEVLVPLDSLDKALEGLEKRIALPMAMEGMVSGSGDVTLLGFILHDQRTFSFNFAFGLALSALKIAKRHGGRAYSTGLYFAKEAENVLGADRVRRLRAFKAQVDPAGLFNPRKVFDGKPLLSTFMATAERFEPIVRVFGNAAKAPVGERIQGQGKRGIPDDVAWYAYSCAQCGYCVDTCDQYYGRGWESQSPRGKWKYLREYMEGKVDWDPGMVTTMMSCTTCELCNVRCPLELPIEPSWLKLRGVLIHDEGRLTLPPFEIMRASLRQEHNIWGALQHKRADWVKDMDLGEIPEKADVAYFAGCTASYVENDIAQGATTLLRKAGVDFTLLGEDEGCCGIPMLVSGLWDAWEEIMRHNIHAMKARHVKTAVTSCPACWLVWHDLYPEWAKKLDIPFEFETRHYSEVLADRMGAGGLVLDHEVNRTVTWHDSCHMGRAGGIYEPPRELIQSIPGLKFVEMEHNREEGLCCGSVLSLVADPEAAQRIGSVRLQEAVDAGAEAIVAACPCCQAQLRITADNQARQNESDPMQVIDLAHLVCEATGVTLPDPTEYMLEQWTTFDAMIRLLRPQAMSDFIIGMLPEMIEAMPAPFRRMMHMVKGSPPRIKNVMLALMKPVMPILFPRLLPGMMPKVMPVMLERMETLVPMSDDMKALMPELMPASMDRLMPKMLPEILPYVVPAMIECMRDEASCEPGQRQQLPSHAWEQRI